MSSFKGFTSSETFTRIPDSFLLLLKEIGDAAELKVALYAIWRVEHIEGNFRALDESDFEAATLGLSDREMRRGLKKAVERGILLKVEHGAQAVYFLNSPRGRLAAGTYSKTGRRGSAQASSPPRARPNIFKLYEENIGPLTPMIADMLKDAENTYSDEWITDAITTAVEHNKRNWKYIEAILKRWKEEGRAKRQDGRNAQKDGQQSLRRKIEQLRKRAGK